MTRNPLFRAWLALVLLSAASTVVALSLPRLQVTIAGTIILTLAWLKARMILSRYLGLAAVPVIARGFGLVLAVYMLVALGLYLSA